eukprot:jgi/Hompol1/2363/HPOL_005784-RA
MTAGHVCVERNKAFFVLNPSMDLVRTQAEFEDTLKRYFGHGGAEQYVRGQSIQDLPRCSITLLFGCSSGYLMPAGEFEPQGTALHYLLAGCPALVANLWDVTDRDIDKFSRSMMQRWGLIDSDAHQPQLDTAEHRTHLLHHSVSIAEAVAQARDDTLLKYLTGAAPVVYGLPNVILRVPCT